ncbi:DUF1778 domain-containing protein [Dickeya chrysanthemi]|uniref:DUF1778 domain-containing protein n=1 Tax=Dickeya chrysanthemi TaxID=556 RepID=A0ABU8JLU5_DICCH
MRNTSIIGGSNDLVSTTKDSRVELRTSSEIKEHLREAASIAGVDMSSFILAAAVQAANRALEEQRIRMLNESEWKKMNEILNTPRHPGERLRNLMTRTLEHERQF